jgi:hypothetical protein
MHKPYSKHTRGYEKHISRLNKLEKLAKNCKFSDNEVKKLRKTDMEAFMIIQKKLEHNKLLIQEGNAQDKEELMQE